MQPLWTEQYQPTEPTDFPQPYLSTLLNAVDQSETNILLSGPNGVGKSVAARTITDKSHTINVSDIFAKTKQELQDEYDKFNDNTLSKRDLINQIINEIAGYTTVENTYKTIILENMEDARTDFQHALRRIIERNAKTTRFIITTRHPSQLITPIKSRLFQIHIRPPDNNEILQITQNIDAPDDVIQYTWQQHKPNVRQFLLTLQTAHPNITVDNIKQTINDQYDETIDELLEYTVNNNTAEIRETVTTLFDDGYTADQLLNTLVQHAVQSYDSQQVKQLCKAISNNAPRVHNSIDPKIQVINILTT